MRIALAQSFSADVALAMLGQIEPVMAPDMIVLPEYCIPADRIADIRYQSSRLNRTSIITAMVIADGVYTRNRAVRFLEGKEHPIYNKLDSELSDVEGDRSEGNLHSFRNQVSMTDRVFVSICNDKGDAKLVIQSPSIWIIPARDSTSQYRVVPPLGFHGHIIFVNGSTQAQVGSYHMQVEDNWQPGSGEPRPSMSIPPGVERMEIITANL